MEDIEKKYKILQVHNYYQLPGGEDIVVANEKMLLESSGHQVIQYTRNNDEIKQFSLWKKWLLPFTAVFSLKTYKSIKSIIDKENIDIVHVHNTLSLISPSVYYAALKCKVPVVQTIHNFRLICPNALLYRDGHICEECLSRGLRCAIRHRCYRESFIQTFVSVYILKIHRLLKTYGKVHYICLTDFNRDMLLTLKQIKPEKVFVKPNFIENKIKKIIPYTERKNQFIYVGRLEKVKGIKILLKAWKQMGNNDVKLIVCGTGPLEQWCKKFIKENDLKMIEMKGFIGNEKVLQTIAESKALIFPTQCYEGFPMTILEAFSVGTPVIVSDLGNAGNIIQEDITGWHFQYTSVESLIKAIEKAIEKSHNISVSAWEIYKKEYSAKANCEMMLDIYKSL